MFASIWNGIKRMFTLPKGHNSASEILGPTLTALKSLGAALVKEAVNNAIGTLSGDVTAISNALFTEIDKVFQGFGAPEWAVLIDEAVKQVSSNASASLTVYKSQLATAIVEKLGLSE
jgi:hypothetical protein